MATDIENARQQRKATRASYTKTVNKLQDVIASESPDIDDMDILLDQLTEKYQDLRNADGRFLELYQKKGCTQDEYSKEYEAAQEYYEKYSTFKIKCNRIRSKQESISNNLSVVASPSLTSTAVVSTKQYLPDIQLPKFDGDPRNWLTFWTQFSKIHEDGKIDVRDKFQYLLQSMKPDSIAKQIVESFPATEVNYEKAVKYLEERFGKESVLIQIYVRELLKLVISDKSKINLLTLYDKLQTQIRSLESLGLTQDKYAFLLFPLVESALPTDLIKIWERQKNATSETGKNDLTLLMEFLKNEVETEFRIKITREVLGPEKLNVKKNKHSEVNSVVPTAYELLNANSNKNTASFNENKFKKPVCIFCQKSHLSENCNDCHSMSLESKKDIIKKKNVCFVCLKANHRASQCRSKHKCPLCKNRHFVVLCPDLSTLTSHKVDNISSSQKVENIPNESENKTSTLNNHDQVSDIFLQTLIVKVKNGFKEMYIRAIIDTGSMKSYLCEDVAKRLNYKCNNEFKIRQSLFGGVETSENVYKNYCIDVSNINGKYECKIDVLGQKRICSEIKQIPSGSWLRELKSHNIMITDLERNSFQSDKEIKLLIGSDIAGKLLTGKVVSLKSGMTAVETKLGWTVMGKFNAGAVEDSKSTASLLISSLLVRDQCLSDLWRLDVLGITDPALNKNKTELQEETKKYFEKTLAVDSEGRYEVALPWIEDYAHLPENRVIAEKCLLSTKRKLKSSGKFEVYGEVFQDWLSLGIIEKAPNENLRGVHYLPHHPVIKESSQTTSIRPVFNASSHAPGRPSLNDCLSTGPNLIEIIPSILIRFRKNYIAITSDIEKAFLQIAIREKDRNFLRFMWFCKDKEDQVEVYRHRRVVFGITVSPYLLAATLQHHLNKVTGSLSHTAEILKTSFYVDNCVTSLHSEEEMRKFVLEAQIIMASGHFNLRGWKSNGNNVGEERDTSAGESVSLLGLLWHTGTDNLSCKVDEAAHCPEPITKRSVLAVTHQIFDPIGYTAPVTLIPKLILQETWNKKLKWDEEIPSDLAKTFKLWFQKLHFLSGLQVPRWFGLQANNESISLHLFCDGSKKAYGACVYLRVANNDKIEISLVHARSRVAPLKPITIPRLELLACTIGSRLMSSIIKDLDLPNIDIYCWTDSLTVLCWIRRDQNWGTFVLNRCREIRSLISPAVWRHVPGTLNPADLASRGCSAEQLLERKWWEGPKWLREKEENWPNAEGEPEEDLVNAEMRKTVITTLMKYDENVNWYYRYFSSYKKIVRMIAWVLRFINNSRKTNTCREDELSFCELECAERTLFLLIQKDAFGKHNKEKIKKLRTFVDEQGVIRVKTQVMYRKDTTNFRYPVLLPSKHPVVTLLISWRHLELLHAGVSLLMTSLRENFWIIKARKTIRAVVQRCVTCKKFDARKTESVPISLPADRVQDVAVFQVVGVDLAGPLYLKGGHKSWIVLYTCAVYRAVHLELVTSLSTEAFLQSLRRFIARRGRPTTVYSDNGTNFVGADKAFSNLDWTRIAAESAVQKIKWKFNPPTAAWWGGWWERLIQMVKRILRKVLGKATLSYEELITVLCDCEQVINSRPLTYVTEDEDDLAPLTPLSFLQENRSSDITDVDTIDNQGLNNRLKHVQQMREHLRKRFRLEYLGQLRQQTINPKIKPLSPNDIVLVENDQKRVNWTLARIMELIPGKDSVPRVARLKTKNGELIRPVQKLYNLEVQRDLSPDPIICTRSGRQVKVPKRLSY